jgi:hypothetical protein
MIERHWAASDRGDIEAEFERYHPDVVVARETQYFADPLPAPGWRAGWVEPIRP